VGTGGSGIWGTSRCNHSGHRGTWEQRTRGTAHNGRLPFPDKASSAWASKFMFAKLIGPDTSKHRLIGILPSISIA
jgi:hypothetical protein